VPAEILWRQGSIVKVRDRRTGGIKWGYVKRIGGKKVRCSAFSSRKQAEDALSTLVYNHHMQKLGVDVGGKPITLRELADLYLEDARDRGVSAGVIDNTSRVLDRLIKILPAKTKLSAITADDLRQYRAARLEDGRHPHTIRFELKRIRSVFLSVRRLYGISWDPPIAPEVKAIHQGREVVLSSGQIPLY
jgi:hypothetical protein